MAAGRKAAHSNFFFGDMPLLRVFPYVADGPGYLLQRGKAARRRAHGIAQDESMEALGRIAQRHRLCLPGGQVQIAAAGTDQHSGPLLLLSQRDLAVQQKSFQGGILMPRDCGMNPFHRSFTPYHNDNASAASP